VERFILLAGTGIKRLLVIYAAFVSGGLNPWKKLVSVAGNRLLPLVETGWR
jgi:hypothetical protein